MDDISQVASINQILISDFNNGRVIPCEKLNNMEMISPLICNFRIIAIQRNIDGTKTEHSGTFPMELWTDCIRDIDKHSRNIDRTVDRT